MIKLMLLAGCGGFVGAAGRFLVCRYSALMWHNSFPLGTFAVNLIGCFLIGVFLGLAAKEPELNGVGTTLLITGFCGGFTTFSTFAGDVLTLSQRGDWATLGLYVVASVVVGVMLVGVGRYLAR